MGCGRMCIWVDVSPGVGGHSVPRSEQGLEARGDAGTDLHDVEGAVRYGVRTDKLQRWFMGLVGVREGGGVVGYRGRLPCWGGREVM